MHVPADAVAAVTLHDPERAPVPVPAARVPDSMACETSVSRLPGTIAAMPASSDSLVASESASSAASRVPTPKVIAASPCQPSSTAPQSMDTRSPGARISAAEGMPCTTRSLTDAQIDAG